MSPRFPFLSASSCAESDSAIRSPITVPSIKVDCPRSFYKQYEYQDFDGTFVPSYVEEQNLDIHTGRAVRIQKYKLLDSEVNVPLEPSVFSLDAFGLVDGERVYDMIEGKLLLKKDGDFVDVSSSVFKKPDLSRVP